jgi:hypothetical protein
LDNLNLDSIGETVGIYIIWHEGKPGKVVRVGQGKIKNRLSAHRNDREIVAYNKKGTLRVTWAAVSSQKDRDGAERYLAETWKPLVGEAFPDVDSIAVNSPFAA